MSAVDALGLEPGEQEMPQAVGCHVVREAGLGGVAGEHGALLALRKFDVLNAANLGTAATLVAARWSRESRDG